MTTLLAGQRRPCTVPLRVLAAALLGALLVLLGVQSASAHAELLSTTPQDGAVLEQAPAEAELTFNEPVQLIEDSIRLFAGDEDPVVLEAHISNDTVIAALPAEVEQGRYALSYRVVSADGHPISGAITFTIGNASGPAPAPMVDTQTPQSTQTALSVLTALQYIALLVFVGLIIFDRAVLRGRGPASARSARVLGWAGIGAAVASVLLVPVSALNVTGDRLGALLTPSQWWGGLLWAPATAAGLVIVAGAGAYVLATRAVERPRARLLALVPAFLALVAPVLVGHTQLIEPRALISASDFGHLLAGSFWVGGVVGLLLFLASARPGDGGTSEGDPMLAAEVVQRFSRLAVWSVALLAALGLVMGLMIVGSLQTLFTTTYGILLLVKVGIIIPIVAIAGYNRFRLLPRLFTSPTARQRWRHLTRALGMEATLLVVVLLVTGFLTNLSPGQDMQDHPGHETAVADTVTLDAQAQGLTIDGTLEPALVGANDLSFALQYQGEAVTSEEVTIRVSLPEHELGPFEVTPEFDEAAGEYSAELTLPVAGEWQVDVVARVSKFDEPIVTVPVTVH